MLWEQEVASSNLAAPTCSKPCRILDLRRDMNLPGSTQMRHLHNDQ